jgi:hypothetical protein
MAFLFFIPLALLYSALLPVNEEVLLLLTLGTMVFTLYNRLPNLVAPYFDAQNSELLQTYRFALEVQNSQFREALALFHSEIFLLGELDVYAQWSLLRLNLLFQLHQEKGSSLISLDTGSSLSLLDQDRKTRVRGFLDLSKTFWSHFLTARLQATEEQLGKPSLLTLVPSALYPFFIHIRMLTSVRGS